MLLLRFFSQKLLQQVPAKGEQTGGKGCLLKLPLDLANQVLALLINGVLGLDGFNLLLAGELFFQREGGSSGAPGFFDEALQADLEAVRPAIELLRLGLVVVGVSFGNDLLNLLLPGTGNLPEHGRRGQVEHRTFEGGRKAQQSQLAR